MWGEGPSETGTPNASSFAERKDPLAVVILTGGGKAWHSVLEKAESHVASNSSNSARASNLRVDFSWNARSCTRVKPTRAQVSLICFRGRTITYLTFCYFIKSTLSLFSASGSTGNTNMLRRMSCYCPQKVQSGGGGSRERFAY